MSAPMNGHEQRRHEDGGHALLNPELRGDEAGHAKNGDGERLSHAEASSRSLTSSHSNQSDGTSDKDSQSAANKDGTNNEDTHKGEYAEPQPRGADFADGKPVDHDAAARRFIAAEEHEKFHDERLWDLRQKRDGQMHGIPEWEELRELASQIKQHTLANLPDYIEEFERNAKANGIHVHWARDGAEHNAIVHSILADHNVKTLIKSKSMLTEETGMRHFLEGKGIAIVETDLGERIQQLDDEPPSHIVVPATHKLRVDVARVFADKLGSDGDNWDAHYLAETQREKNRPLILNADAGMTGGNFMVAETGSFVVCTNEGNADLSANVPPLHIASIGIEKLVPRMADLGVFIRLLSRSALGSPITQYTSHFKGPRKGGEMHIVLVDNGRSKRLGMKEFWTSLKCIRCGACMNTCPVYRRSGGLSYGATYSGPIGVILDPTFDKKKYASITFSSTLNGSCSNVCPVKINIHEQIFAWRKELASEHEIGTTKQMMMKAAGALLSRPAAYRAAIGAADSALRVLPQFLTEFGASAWTRDGRQLPEAPKETFHQWFERTGGVTDDKQEAGE